MFRNLAGPGPRVREGVSYSRRHEHEATGTEQAPLPFEIKCKRPFQDVEDVGHPCVSVPDGAGKPGRHDAFLDRDRMFRSLSEETHRLGPAPMISPSNSSCTMAPVMVLLRSPWLSLAAFLPE